MHEGERVNGEQLSTHQEITQPLVREALEQRIEREGQDGYFNTHINVHRKKTRARRSQKRAPTIPTQSLCQTPRLRP